MIQARELVERGFTVTHACETVGISRSAYYLEKGGSISPRLEREPYGEETILAERIGSIKTEHPFWGYRRVRAWLAHREGYRINHKRVYRIMKERGLLVKQPVHHAKRTLQRSKPRAARPREFWGIDMTKFMVGPVGWVYLVIVLDWYTKKMVGWDLSLRSRTQDWKRALDRAVLHEFPDGVRGMGLKLISDNGSQPTSCSFMSDMSRLGIEQIFTSYDNPKGNADTERMMRTIKEEVIWLNDFSSFEEATAVIGNWIENEYNRRYVHSALGYRSPEEFERLYMQNCVPMAA
jgi:transposase InsO family protein